MIFIFVTITVFLFVSVIVTIITNINNIISINNKISLFLLINIETNIKFFGFYIVVIRVKNDFFQHFYTNNIYADTLY